MPPPGRRGRPSPSRGPPRAPGKCWGWGKALGVLGWGRARGVAGPPPPRPPPLGPPNSMNFSRRKLRQPLPPSPLRTQILAWSRKRMNEKGKAAAFPSLPPVARGALLRGRGHRLDVDVGAAQCRFEGNVALDQGEDRVVAAEAYILAGPPLGAALTNDDVARDHGLAAVLLDPQALARRIAAVAGAA